MGMGKGNFSASSRCRSLSNSRNIGRLQPASPCWGSFHNLGGILHRLCASYHCGEGTKVTDTSHDSVRCTTFWNRRIDCYGICSFIANGFHISDGSMSSCILAWDVPRHGRCIGISCCFWNHHYPDGVQSWEELLCFSSLDDGKGYGEWSRGSVCSSRCRGSNSRKSPWERF